MTYSQVLRNLQVVVQNSLTPFIDGSITDITSNVETIYPYAFYLRNKLITASFPKAKSLWNGFNFFRLFVITLY